MENRQEFQKRMQEEANEIIEKTKKPYDTIQYLREIGIYDEDILCDTDECINFEGPTQLLLDNDSTDGYRLICQGCKSTYSVRKNSALYQVRTPASTVMRVIVKETFGQKSHAKIAKEYGISRQTASKILDYSRNAIAYKEKQIRESKILGLEIAEDADERHLEYASAAVEVDECMLTKMGPHQCWVLGIYDRALEDCIMIVVGNNRSQQVIDRIFQQYVATEEIQKARVYCDMWRGYNGLQNLDYEVIRINHSREFGEGHRTTNHIEASWRVLRKFCRFDSGYRVKNIVDAQIEVDFAWAYIRNNKNNGSCQQLILDSIQQYSSQGYTINNFKDYEEQSEEEEGDEIEGEEYRGMDIE